jgi:hypothetical protein
MLSCLAGSGMSSSDHLPMFVHQAGGLESSLYFFHAFMPRKNFKLSLKLMKSPPLSLPTNSPSAKTTLSKTTFTTGFSVIVMDVVPGPRLEYWFLPAVNNDGSVGIAAIDRTFAVRLLELHRVAHKLAPRMVLYHRRLDRSTQGNADFCQANQ